MMYTAAETKLFAKSMWMEARKTSVGMRAVGHVVLNRISAAGFPKSIAAVIEQPNAFSWTRPSNPEYGRDPAKSTGQDLVMWYEAQRLASILLNTNDPDPTSGAVWYENPKNVAAESWFARNISGQPEKHPMTVQIGEHQFFS